MTNTRTKPIKLVGKDRIAAVESDTRTANDLGRSGQHPEFAPGDTRANAGDPDDGRPGPHNPDSAHNARVFSEATGPPECVSVNLAGSK